MIEPARRAAFPRAFLATPLTAASYQRVMGANNRLGVGFIGFGLIGKRRVGDSKKMTDIDFVGMCDCYKSRLDEAMDYIGNPKSQAYADLQKMHENKDMQGVVISTHDHWHALQTILACAAGKDVYVKKPQTLFTDEGKWMVQAARKYNRMVCARTQRRHGTGVKEAGKVIQSGVVGKIHSIRVGSHRNIYPGFGVTPLEQPPADFDYDMWLGPAENKPYRRHRGIYHFRWLRDFSGGQMTNLGAHQSTRFSSAPERRDRRWHVRRRPRCPRQRRRRHARQAGRHMGISGRLRPLSCASREANAFSDPTARGQPYLGTKGNLTLSGSYTIASETKWINPENEIPRFLGRPAGGPRYDTTGREPFPPRYAKDAGSGVTSDSRYGLGGEDTMMMNEGDWRGSMCTRKLPFCDVAEGHRVAVVCHLANMSIDLRRAIRWDPDKEQVGGDKEAQAACSKPYRAPWDKVLRSIVTV